MVDTGKLSGIVTQCAVYVQATEKHLESKCTTHTITSSLHTIMDQPVATPLADEKKWTPTAAPAEGFASSLSGGEMRPAHQGWH